MSNRKFKFRAFHEKSKSIIYFNNKKLIKDPYQMEHLSKLINGDYGDVLMQYTGLEDSNGKEIYEGDIISIGGMNDYPFEVKHTDIINGCLGMYVGYYLRRPNGSHTYLDSGDQHNYEVIGNIHENPELLEGGKS